MDSLHRQCPHSASVFSRPKKGYNIKHTYTEIRFKLRRCRRYSSDPDSKFFVDHPNPVAAGVAEIGSAAVALQWTPTETRCFVGLDRWLCFQQHAVAAVADQDTVAAKLVRMAAVAPLLEMAVVVAAVASAEGARADC